MAGFIKYQIIYFSRIQSEKALDDIPVYKNILEKFTTNEIVRQEDFCNQFQAELRETEAFSKSEMGDKRWGDLKSRIVEHNIRMMAKYYTKIRLARMSNLLALSESEVEDCLSEMVSWSQNKTISISLK